MTLSSLRGRMFLASVLVALACVALALQFVSSVLAAAAERDLQTGLSHSAEEVLERQTARASTLLSMARLIADLPKLKAAVETGDAPTVEPIARDYQARAHADLFVVTDARGRPLVSLGGQAPDPAATQAALGHAEASGFLHLPRGLLQVVTVPITIGPAPAEVLGTLSVGLALDDALARQLRAATESEVLFVQAGELRAGTLPGVDVGALTALLDRAPVASLWAADQEFVALRRSLGDGPDAPQAVILRSRTERLRVLNSLRTAFLAALALAVLLAVGLSWAVARSVTRPLTAITATMRETAVTGDLGQRLELKGRWQDEDARTLAQAFNSLLLSLGHFQREAARRQRLSALGRLSTVIAHEIRNPLMVIKSTLPALRRPAVPGDELRAVAQEIDAEIGRIDRIVGDVLDFTREVRIARAPADLCRIAQRACEAALQPHSVPYVLSLPERLPSIETDAERVHQVLVALLSNAREAMHGPSANDGATIGVYVTVAGERVAVEVADRGPGIAEADMSHVFEPYFTTKRTGTGLGLAIAKNVAEALGGSLSASARPGGGALLRLELPLDPGPHFSNEVP